MWTIGIPVDCHSRHDSSRRRGLVFHQSKKAGKGGRAVMGRYYKCKICGKKKVGNREKYVSNFLGMDNICGTCGKFL